VGDVPYFRHTLGSLLHDERAKTLRQTSDWLGHADPSFTLREYVHSSDLGDADFLDELIPDGSVAPNVAPNPPEADSSQKKTPDYQGV
jgi:hypothetical protein